MKITKLAVEGFRAFAERSEFDFAGGEPGFYFMTGDNQAEPQLGSNGAGKSTLLVEALFWILKGKTTRGLKASNIATWRKGKSKTVRGELEFDLDGHHWLVVRQWNPVKLWVGKDGGKLEPWQQSEVEALIKLNEVALTNCLLIPQINPLFLDLKPAEKLAVFTEILPIAKWEHAAKLASTRASAARTELEARERAVSDVRGELRAHRHAVKEAKIQKAHWKQRHEQRMAVARQRVKESEEALATATANLEKAYSQYKTVTVPAKLRKELEERRERLRVAKDAAADAAAAANKAAGMVHTLEQRAQKHSARFAEGVCPTCGQSIDGSAVHEHLKEQEQEIAQYRKRHKAAAAKQSKAEKKLPPLKEKVRELEQQEYALEQERLQQEYALERLKDKEVSLAEKLEQEQSNLTQLEQLTMKEDLGGDPVRSARRQVRATKAMLKDAKAEATEQQELVKAYEYWSNGFRDIRLKMVEQALTQFEVEVNNCLVELGLYDWAVKFDIERENKSGGFTKGFSVFIRSPHNFDRWVPWEAWSGGEGQRLRIAGTMGLSNLISAYTGVTPSLQVWDEPTQHLNEGGVQALLELLAARAVDQRKQIYLIDHRSLEAGHFDRVYTVVRNQHTSYIKG